jgi:formylglycine-generating enzyme required for sulfatase activity
VTDVNVACTTNRYDIGGTINGLVGAGLVLQNNASDDLAPTADGTFTFPTKVASNTNYAVTIATQPSGQTCSVAAGDGKVTGQAVTTVQIECSTNAYSVGGTVTGLAGTGLHLKDTVSNQVVDVGGTSFAIGSFQPGATYNIVVDQNPTNKWQTCSTTANGSGTVGDGDISNVTVNCTTNQYHLSGTITGLLGSGIVLSNLTQTTTLAALATTFSFTRALDSGAAYTVTVTTSPSNPTQHCTLTSSSGVVAGADISNVEISCTTTPFRIGGTVTGLLGTGLVLQNNGGDDRPIPENGLFTFTSTVLSQQPYAVTVLTQPQSPWQTCLTSSSAGTADDHDITNVGISCTTKTYAVGGSISGLSSTAGITLTLINNANSSTLATTLFHNGDSPSFTVSSSVSFSLTTTQPTVPWQTCSISHSTDTVTGTAISDVNITCTTNTYQVRGTVTGLEGSGLQLHNGSDTLTVVSETPAFTFPTLVASSSTYAVTVTDPTNPWQHCTVSNGTGTVTGTPITNVAVSCTTNSYHVGGSVSGLVGTGLVLKNNGSDPLTVVSGTPQFTFATTVASSSTYAVTVSTSPTGPLENCTVSSGTGTVTGTPITNVAVTCSTTVTVPGGTMTLGANDQSNNPPYSSTVATFLMDVGEVTVSAYASCVAAVTCTLPDTSANCTWGVSGKENHPINCVDWQQATDFCSSTGKRLPTEQEWEYAARYDDSRDYPWGSAAPSATLANYSSNVGGTTAVGSYPSGASKLGIQDLAGNVWEWTSTWYTSGTSRVLRGGSWSYAESTLRAAYRFGYSPSNRHSLIGFRCARTP